MSGVEVRMDDGTTEWFQDLKRPERRGYDWMYTHTFQVADDGSLRIFVGVSRREDEYSPWEPVANDEVAYYHAGQYRNVRRTFLDPD